MTTQITAVAIFLALTAADTIVGVLLSCVKLKQPFSLQKLVHQLEAQGMILLAQLGALIAQPADTTPGSTGAAALTTLVYAAAVAGSANLAKDIVNKLTALVGNADAPVGTSGPQGSATPTA
jgi:hypothetical protein